MVGGYAVGVYAEPRATKDLDLFIRSDVKNSEAVFDALAAFGAPLSGISPVDFRDAPTAVFQLGNPPGRVDILQSIDAVTFEEAWTQRTDTIVDGVSVQVISANSWSATNSSPLDCATWPM